MSKIFKDLEKLKSDFNNGNKTINDVMNAVCSIYMVAKNKGAERRSVEKFIRDNIPQQYQDDLYKRIELYSMM